MRIFRRFLAIAVGFLLLFGLGAVSPASPQANAASSTFRVCFYSPACYHYTAGEITWYNRTAYVSGNVFRDSSTTQAVFEAFAGSTKIDSQARTVSHPDRYRGFGFAIGDTNLVGGIDRIKITVCVYRPNRLCGTSVHYSKP